MTQDNRFISVAELAIQMESIKEIVSTIEEQGFYGWDRFGRFVKVPANPISRESILLLESLLDEIANSIIADELNLDYFDKALRDRLSPVCNCGWPVSELPEIYTIYSDWKEKQFGDSSFKEPEKQKSLQLSEVKKKDDWYDLIVDAFRQYEEEYGVSPSASKLWSYLAKTTIHGWKNTFEDKNKDKCIVSGGESLAKDNFTKRFNKYFH